MAALTSSTTSSTAGLQRSSANDTGQRSPSSSFAVSFEPKVEYREPNSLSTLGAVPISRRRPGRARTPAALPRSRRRRGAVGQIQARSQALPSGEQSASGQSAGRRSP